jgi:hypothetical protein
MKVTAALRHFHTFGCDAMADGNSVLSQATERP